MNKFLLSISASSILFACTVGPDYQKPEIGAPPQFVSQDVLDALNDDKTPTAFSTDWWVGFQDPILNQLVDAGIEKNFEIAAATARVKEAQARVQLADAGDNLTVDANVDGDIQESKRLNRGSGSTTSESVFGSVGAVLPLDVFGKTRREVEAARANLEGSQEALKSIVLDTSSQITSEYLSLRGNQRQLELLQESVVLQEKTLSIVRSRFDAGLSPELDLQRAIASVENLRAQIPPLEERLRNSRNRLAGLTGEFPGFYEELLSKQSDIPEYRDRIPELMPLDVLDARPDVRQTEADLKQAIANIGVAEADYYPSFALAGDISIGLNGVSSTPTTALLIGSIAGLIEQVVLSGGERDANFDIATAQAEEALANYELALRSAVEDVETSLNALRSSSERQKSLAKSVKASERSFSQAQTLYRQGLISFLDVVDAQQDLADDEQDLAAERTDYATEIANLFRALGTDVQIKSKTAAP